MDYTTIGDSTETTDGLQNVLTKDILILIRERIFANMEPNSFQNNHRTGILAIRVVEVLMVDEFTFNSKYRLSNSRGLDFA